MSKMVQVRDVPDDVHALLVARAADEGMSLSGYLGRQLREIVERPTARELAQRAERRSSKLSLDESAALIRADRDTRR